MKYICKAMITVFMACSIALLSSSYQMDQAQAISLYGDGGRGGNMFVDRKAHQVGDILTIIISERTTTTLSKSTDNSKSGQQTLGAGVGWLDFFKATSANQNDKFTATGNATSSNRYAANITVTVVDVLDNGNLVVEGKQSIWQNKNEEKITISGIIRPDDIGVNNTIPSTKVADATIKFDGKGPLNAKQRQGILTQIFNFLF